MAVWRRRNLRVCPFFGRFTGAGDRLFDGLANAQRSCEPVDVRPLQGQQFTPSCASGESDIDERQRPVASARGPKAFHFFGREGAGFHTFNFRQLYPQPGIDLDFVQSKCFIEREDRTPAIPRTLLGERCSQHFAGRRRRV